MGLVAIAVFRVAQPYAFGGTNLAGFQPGAKWLSSMGFISQLIRGERIIRRRTSGPDSRQFVFPWVNMVVWGMGLPLGLAAWAGWAVAAWQGGARGLAPRVTCRRVTLTWPMHWRHHLLPVVWIGGMFAYHSMQFSFTMRYYLPIYPLLVMMAAWLLWWLVERAQKLETGS